MPTLLSLRNSIFLSVLLLKHFNKLLKSKHLEKDLVHIVKDGGMRNSLYYRNKQTMLAMYIGKLEMMPTKVNGKMQGRDTRPKLQVPNQKHGENLCKRQMSKQYRRSRTISTNYSHYIISLQLTTHHQIEERQPNSPRPFFPLLH